jgi:hypothetical protein
VPASELDAVIDAYSYALTRAFVLAAALRACMILGALLVEWKSIKDDKSRTSNDSTSVPEKIQAARAPCVESAVSGEAECKEDPQ